MKSEPLFKQHLVGAVPALRAFALTLCRTGHLADDLVQETLLRAWEHQDQFSPGTNFKAWIFTILRKWDVEEDLLEGMANEAEELD